MDEDWDADDALDASDPEAAWRSTAPARPVARRTPGIKIRANHVVILWT